MNKPGHFGCCLVTLGLLLLTTLICLLLQEVFDIHQQQGAIFVFAVFLTALFTERYVYGIVSAFLGTLLMNFAFTYPYYTLNFSIPENLLSALVMVTIALMTCTLTNRIRRWESAKAEGERERMRANLLRAVSHDLRTPLTNIYASSSALLEQDSLTKQQTRSILTGIREDADWLVRMVENLLSVTRIDSGQVKLIKTETVLEELIDSVIRKFHRRYPRQQVDIRLPEEILLIPMDAMLIQQVLMNLLENAVRHAEGMTQLLLQVHTQGNTAVFTVRDDGSGIPENQLPLLFSGRHTEPADGRKGSAGIGLSVCATIIRAHGGTIHAENHKEGGAEFRFTLDMEEASLDE